MPLVTVPTGAAVLVTVIGPLVAVVGTVALSTVAEVCVTVVDATPLNFTVEVLVKPTPLIVTIVPVGPLAGVNDLIDNVGVKFVAETALPAPVVTVIGAAIAPFGTVTLSWVGLWDVTVARLVPNFTTGLGRRPLPWIVTVRR